MALRRRQTAAKVFATAGINLPGKCGHPSVLSWGVPGGQPVGGCSGRDLTKRRGLQPAMG